MGGITREKVVSATLVYLKIILGSLIYAASFRYLTYPNSIVVGGVTGIAMILNLLVDLPVGIMIIVINIPLFIVAWRGFGTKFIIASLVSMLLSSSAIDIMGMFPVSITSEPMLAAIYGGLATGFGLGLVYSTGATSGGIDIAAKFLRQKLPHVNFGTFVLILDVAVVVIFALVFGKYDSCMYAAISMFVFSKVVDFMLYGAVNSKVCFIITYASSEVKTAIGDKLNRGATLLAGKGAYSGLDKEIIMCVLKSRQIVQLRRLVREIDGRAFMIISDAREVFGEGFADISEDE